MTFLARRVLYWFYLLYIINLTGPHFTQWQGSSCYTSLTKQPGLAHSCQKVQLYRRAKNFRDCARFVFFNTKMHNLSLFYLFWVILNFFGCFLPIFFAKLLNRNIGCAKKKLLKSLPGPLIPNLIFSVLSVFSISLSSLIQYLPPANSQTLGLFLYKSWSC